MSPNDNDGSANPYLLFARECSPVRLQFVTVTVTMSVYRSVFLSKGTENDCILQLVYTYMPPRRRWFHYAREWPRRLQAPERLGSGYKPRGCLWLSCGSAWLRWLRREEMDEWEERYRSRFEVELDTSRVICLRTRRDIAAFDARFGVSKPGKMEDGERYTTRVVAWDRVRTETGAAGVAFIYTRRRISRWPVVHWYTTLDVCSAAVWDMNAVRLAGEQGRRVMPRRVPEASRQANANREGYYTSTFFSILTKRPMSSGMALNCPPPPTRRGLERRDEHGAIWNLGRVGMGPPPQPQGLKGGEAFIEAW